MWIEKICLNGGENMVSEFGSFDPLFPIPPFPRPIFTK
jgi:hypothetical protein